MDNLTKNEYLNLKKGLAITGWYVDHRLTTEEIMMLKEISEKALLLNKSDTDYLLDVEKLSLEVFNIIRFCLENPVDRAAIITYGYQKSQYLSGAINMIEESICAYYSGFYTSGLSLLFIALESSLRNISGWAPGDPDITFMQLKESISNLPKNEYHQIAQEVVNIVYSRYDPLKPSQFFFNRHGLLHGLRISESKYDQMNFLRLLSLFDMIIFCDSGVRDGVISKEFNSLLDKFTKI